ncbi:MAG: hypothetical protein HRU38_22875 [Saccharospirillaceae bacterium]|nr:hypothetical protein [Pseudomonadales bacterium]NRB81468.1 hypothetical protein [Saccharospirillaceae bacterium]
MSIYIYSSSVQAQKIVWVTDQVDQNTLINKNIHQGLELAVLFLQSKKVDVNLKLMTYNEVATQEVSKTSEIDWVILGPQSKQISQLTYLNKIRNNNQLQSLPSFVIWQDPINTKGITAGSLELAIDGFKIKGALLFSDQYRLWQAHVKFSSYRESEKTLGFAQFLSIQCESKDCTQLYVYPHEQSLLLAAMTSSKVEYFEKLQSLKLQWVLINATLEQIMQFSAFNPLIIVGFYHYQQNTNPTNEWLIEHYLSEYHSAPNQYVALGFQSVLQMSGQKAVDLILTLDENHLIWQKHQIEFQKGWPVLHLVEMN